MSPFFKKPKYSTIRGITSKTKKNIPEGLWQKCKSCGEVVHQNQLKENQQVCPNCSFHNPLTCQERLDLIADEGSFVECDANIQPVDALKFFATYSYGEKLLEYQQKTKLQEAVLTGTATIHGQAAGFAIMDFRFLGASMGSVVGEKITRIVEQATAKRLPMIIVSTSGGARMHEGTLSLMQMAKTSAALARHDRAGLFFISVLTHPTTGGVTASFASLGDVIVAEPGALIGFAGPRVIKQTTQAILPDGFQTAEFLLEKGFIDRIIERAAMRDELGLLLDYFAKAG